MNYILYLLFTVVILLLIALLLKSISTERKLKESISKSEDKQMEIEQFKMVSEGKAISSQLSKYVQELHQQVHGFSKTVDQKLNYVLDYEQALANIFINNKTRGIYGETQLNLLLQNYLGEHHQLYQSQYQLSNGTIVDFAIFIGEQQRVLAIDSKFPMQNYLKFQEAENDFDKNEAFKQFKINMKSHIDAVSSKYITEETLNQAILFLPSEAIYYFILSECPELSDYAIKKKVNITSPTTLFPICSAIITYHKEVSMVNGVKQQVELISKLEGDIHTLVSRYDDTAKTLDTLIKKFENMNITIRKIESKHNKISNMHLDNKEELI